MSSGFMRIFAPEDHGSAVIVQIAGRLSHKLGQQLTDTAQLSARSASWHCSFLASPT